MDVAEGSQSQEMYVDQSLEGGKVLAYNDELRATVDEEYNLLLRDGGTLELPLMVGRSTGRVGGSVTGIETVRGLGGIDAGGLGRADAGGTGREGGGRCTGGDCGGVSTSDKSRTRAGGAGGPSKPGGLREGGGGTARAGEPTIEEGLAGGGGGAFLAGGTGGCRLLRAGGRGGTERGGVYDAGLGGETGRAWGEAVRGGEEAGRT
jgi:hypothetical protein